MLVSSLSPAIWLVFGIVLILTELMATSVIMVFFGAGALIVAALTLAGVTTSISAQVGVFAISSLALLLLARKHLRKVFVGKYGTSAAQNNSSFVGMTTRISDVTEYGDMKVVVNGASWKALHEAPLPVGTPVRVTAVEGIAMRVAPISANEEIAST